MSSFLSHRRKAFRGGAFAPTDIAGCDLWLDASDSSTLFNATTGGSTPADNESVARWEDKSANANHATQTNASFRPDRRVSEVNGLDTIDFDGGNDELIGASDLTSRQSDAKTVFVVVAADVTGILIPFCLYNNIGTSSGQTGAITIEIGYRCITYTWLSSTPVSTTGASMISLTQASTGDLHAAVSMWLDGTSVTRTTGTDGTLSDLSNPYVVGESGTGGNYDGDLCEIIVYDTELSTTDRETVETYLANKWGITI
jgi:hypothetical protein